jgi:hypothetical protein
MYIPNKQNKKVLPNSPYVWKAEELNQITQELQNVIMDAGITLDENQTNQVITAVNNKITTASQGGSLQAYDFGVSNPTAEALTLRAMTDIFGEGGTWTLNVQDISQSTYVVNGITHTASEIFNKTWITNLFNSSMWQLTNTPNTSPAIFSWANIGFIGNINVEAAEPTAQSTDLSATSAKRLWTMLGAGLSTLATASKTIVGAINEIISNFAKKNLSNHSLGTSSPLAIVSGVSKSNNGYIKFTNGLTIQWGSTTINANGTTVNFPIAFSSSCSFAIGTIVLNTGSSNNTVTSYNLTTTSFTMYKPSNNQPGIWLAIGY